jgi:hypothetical protein
LDPEKGLPSSFLGNFAPEKQLAKKHPDNEPGFLFSVYSPVLEVMDECTHMQPRSTANGEYVSDSEETSHGIHGDRLIATPCSSNRTYVEGGTYPDNRIKESERSPPEKGCS